MVVREQVETSNQIHILDKEDMCTDMEIQISPLVDLNLVGLKLVTCASNKPTKDVPNNSSSSRRG